MQSVAEPSTLHNLSSLLNDVYGFDAQDAARTAYRTAVHTVAVQASAKLPESLSRLEKAEALVLAGDVVLLDGHQATVGSQSHGGTTYHVAPGTCDCKDFAHAPHQLCKHRLGAAMARRALGLVQASPPAIEAPIATPSEQPSGIPAQYLVMIKGKAFVRYAGLLAMAHEHGLISLKVEWTYNDAELSLAHAVAAFNDGTSFEDSGDATPRNVSAGLAPHFRRIALTRAKARCLRDALGLDMCSVEELAE